MRNLKKLISVLIAALLGVLLIAPAFAAGASGNCPTIYVKGYGSYIYNEEGEKIGPVDLPEGYITDAVKDCMPLFVRAYITKTKADIEAYKTKLLGWIAPLYADLILDENGDKRDDSHIWFTVPSSVRDQKIGGVYPVDAYNFNHDWRIDPWETADLIAQYVDVVLAGTGARKVNLIGRCEGSCHVMAYLAKYGHEKVNRVFFNCPSIDGYLLSSQLFSGKVNFDAENIDLWLNTNDQDITLPEGEIFELLRTTLDLFAATPGIDLSGVLLNDVFDTVLRPVLPDVMLATYANMPGMWAMTSEADFEDAISYVFEGKEQKYAGLIAKIRNFHENVAMKEAQIIADCQADGVEFGVMTKYGYPSVPIFVESDLLSDGYTALQYSSFGATTSDYNTTLHASYIKSQEAKGLGKYISADKKVDASTCLLPDTTWFVGGISHVNFPEAMEILMQHFLTSDNLFTVDSDPRYPQFSLYDESKEVLVPLTEKNAASSIVGADVLPSFGDSLTGFIARVRAFIEKFVYNLRALITGIVGEAQAMGDHNDPTRPVPEPDPEPIEP